MKACVYTLGCKVNTYESEYMMDLLQKQGYTLADFDTISDVYVINTCTVTNQADVKSRKVIRECYKKNPNAILVVVGCHAQNHKDSIIDDPMVSIALGNKNKSKIISYLEEYQKTRKKIVDFYDMQNQSFEPMEITNFPTKTRAFVKIQDGCNNYCSYCIIPYVRGNLRYKPKEDVLREITNLVKEGYQEIVLTGIHTGSYGNEQYRFSDLLRDIVKIEGLHRLRISSIEITEIDDAFIELLKDCTIIANHLHIPLQSGSDEILRRMNRKYDTAYFKEVIQKIRAVRPDIAITTDVIVGFPSETDANFLETEAFIKEVSFSFVHVFPYSKRDGTKAAEMSCQVDGTTKKLRAHTLIALSKTLDKTYMSGFLSDTVLVLGETIEEGIVTGHTSNYLKVKFEGTKEDINRMTKVRLTHLAYPYLFGLKSEQNCKSQKSCDECMRNACC